MSAHIIHPVLSDQKIIPQFLSGGGEMGELLRSIDWSQTSLGPIANWPQSLRTTISVCLNSKFPILIWWGPEMIMLYNDAYRSLAGDKHPHSLGASGREVWPEIWHILGPMLESVFREGKSVWFENQLLLVNRYGFAEECYFTYSNSPIYVESGGIGGIFCAVTETTETVVNNRHLRTLSGLGHHAAEIKSPLDIYTGALEVLKSNPYDFPFALIYDVHDNGSEATLAGASGIPEQHPAAPQHIVLNEAQPWAQEIQLCISTNQPVVVPNLRQMYGDLPSGAWSVPPEKAYVVPIARPGRKVPYGILITGINAHAKCTEKYRSFYQLAVDQLATEIANVNAYNDERKRVEALTELNRAKTAFFSNISHEFRTPLTLMLGPLEDMLHDQRLCPENRDRVQLAHRNALRQLKLVNSLLDFSRIEAGRMQARFNRVNLAAITRDLASSFRSAIEKADMQLVVDCDEIPGPAYVDADMWEKIILNLLSNAFKYTLKGTISVQLKQQDGLIECKVRDTGIGIPEEEQPRLFERFHRIHHCGRSQEGTGIGLALVQELVKLHKGTVAIESRPNRGTQVTVTIPAGKDHLPSDQIGSGPEQTDNTSLTDLYLEEALSWLPGNANNPVTDAGTAAIPPLRLKSAEDKRLQILLVDDNKDMRTYLTRLLESRYQVTAVENGAQALVEARKILPDLVLTDVMMPEMDGLALVKALRNDTAMVHTPIILLSARAGEEATIEGLEAGVDDYMVKPFSAKELLTRIDTNIKVARSRIYAARQMHNLFMNTPLPIAILAGPELRYKLVNDAFRSLMRKDNVLGKTISEVFPEVANQGVFPLIKNVYDTGTPFIGHEFKVTLTGENGEPKVTYFDFAFSPMYELNGDIIGVIGVGTDCTDKVEARARLKENEERLQLEVEQRTIDLKNTNEALARSNKDLEQYAFVTSHDLQEPLRKIQTFANQLYRLNKEQFDDSSHVYWHKMMSASKRMSTLINDLLYFSRLTHEEKFAPTDLNRILEEVVDDFELLIDEKNATIQSEPLPVIDAIPLQVNQLFSNLLSNALKFSSPDRKPLLYISARLATAEELAACHLAPSGLSWYKIVFRDNGIGFDPRYSQKIFEVFQRLNDRVSYEGTGMGLAMCNRIVSNHHGIIYAKGQENIGAEFHLILPEKHVG